MKKIVFTLFILFAFCNIKAQNPEIEKLWKQLNKGNPDQVIDKADALLAKDQNNIELNNLMGRAYFIKGDIETAILYLEKSIKTNNPKSYTKAWGLNYLGRCSLLKGDFEKAKDYFHESYEMKATKNVTNSSYMLMATCGFVDYYSNWEKIETEHFLFYFQDSIEYKKFIESREFAFDSISNYLNVKLEKKIKYFVWSSREDAKKVLLTDLGFAKPEIYLIHSAFNQTFGHEITHVISNYITKIKAKTGLINEGTAVYLDLVDRNDKDAVLSAMKKYKLKKISVKSFWDEWNKYSDEISYPLAGLFVGDLIEKYGKEKFLTFFADQSYENAEIVFGNGFNDFVKEFENKF